jgi:3',5'-cyclic AMP phosphodiesterase CpdA
MKHAFVSGRTSAALVAALVLAGCISTTRPPASSAVPAVPRASLQVYAAGDIADCGRRAPADSMAARTSRLVPDGALVLGLGDMAYPLGDAQTLASCYEPTWGRHRAATLATPGNHDYVRGNADDFLQYFGAGAPHDGGFIAFTRALTDDWQLIALDSYVEGRALQAQYEWLERLLADDAQAPAHTQDCLLVMWHAPFYSSGMHRGSGDKMRRFWQLIDRYGADLVLSGHEHFYERFDPLDAEDHRATARRRGNSSSAPVAQNYMGSGDRRTEAKRACSNTACCSCRSSAGVTRGVSSTSMDACGIRAWLTVARRGTKVTCGTPRRHRPRIEFHA